MDRLPWRVDCVVLYSPCSDVKQPAGSVPRHILQSCSAVTDCSPVQPSQIAVLFSRHRLQSCSAVTNCSPVQPSQIAVLFGPFRRIQGPPQISVSFIEPLGLSQIADTGSITDCSPIYWASGPITDCGPTAITQLRVYHRLQSRLLSHKGKHILQLYLSHRICHILRCRVAESPYRQRYSVRPLILSNKPSDKSRGLKNLNLRCV